MVSDMKYFYVAAALVAFAAPPAIAQPAPASDRTVQYYTNNPYVREKVLEQCYDAPLRLQNNPDCLSAKKGEIADEVKKGSDLFFHGKVPSPEYYSWDHQQRAAALAICHRMTAAQKAAYGGRCEAADASLANDQRQATGSLPLAPNLQ
jgi:hypothetical protein